jgi:nickel-dependent lactate racemase
MKIKLAYGRSGLDVNLPDTATVIEQRHVPGLKDEKRHALESLRKPIGTRPLKEMVKASDKVSIVISDITRPTPNHKLVPWIMEELSHVPDRNITIINGTGTHRDNTTDELAQMLGSDVVKRVKVVNNNAFDKTTQVRLGTTKGGAEVFLNREFMESNFKIVTGFIEPHFFAGFSGGPKGIMPALAGIDTIMHFHSVDRINNPNCTWGTLDGNPVQEMATEVALMSKPDFLFNVALNGNNEITAFFAGDVIAAHRAGCKYVKEHAMAKCAERFDIVVTTNGGHPLDQNLYQAVKGMCAAKAIVKKGGTIICAAECRDGIPDHGNYFKILHMAQSPQAILDMINSPSFSMPDQWQVQKQALVLMWADVHLYSSLSREVCEQAMLKHTTSIEATVDKLLRQLGSKATIAVMPLGPLTIPRIGG